MILKKTLQIVMLFLSARKLMTFGSLCIDTLWQHHGKEQWAVSMHCLPNIFFSSLRRSRGKLMLYRWCWHPDLVLFSNKFNLWHFNCLLWRAFIFQYIMSILSPLFFRRVISLLISVIFPYITFFQRNGHIPNRIEYGRMQTTQ